MPLSEDQRIEIRRQIGNAPSDTDLDVIFARLGDDLDALVLEVLEIRLAEQERNPASFTVPGEYGETRTDKQIEALRAKVAAAGGAGAVRLVPPPDRYVR